MLKQGPAYLIFPIICLSPVVTIVMSFTLLGERTFPLARAGILLSIPAILLLSIQGGADSPVHGYLWLVWSIAIFLMWGLQAYFIKSSADAMSAEEVFIYMTVTGLALSPLAVIMGPMLHGHWGKALG